MKTIAETRDRPPYGRGLAANKRAASAPTTPAAAVPVERVAKQLYENQYGYVVDVKESGTNIVKFGPPGGKSIH
jgi:hypothetical protein